MGWAVKKAFKHIFFATVFGRIYSHRLVTIFLLFSISATHVFAQQAQDFDTLVREGAQARERKEFNLSIELLQQAADLSPEDPRALLELAVTYEWSGRLMDAETIYRNLLKKHEKNPAATLGLARVLRWRWQFEEALAYYDKALSLEELTPPARLEAQLGIAQIDRLEMRLGPARKRLQSIFQLDPLNVQALDEIKQLEGASKHRLLLLAGNRDSSTGAVPVLRAEWLLQQDARTLWRFGAGRNSGAQQALATDTPNNDRQNVVFVEQTYAVPQARALWWRGEYRNREGQANEYQLQGTWSEQLSSMWRANAGLILVGPSASTSRTLLAGLSPQFAQYWEAGLTGYITTGGVGPTQKTWLARLQWQREGVLAQAFVSRELGQAAYKQTFLIRWPVGQGYQLRMQVGRDGVSKINSWSVGVDIPFGKEADVQLVREVVGNERAVYVGANIPLRNLND
jgi:tetratricopeptide (TPR) repeat protein